MRTLGAVVLLALLVSACAQEYQTFEAPPLDFSDRRPLLLRVDQVRVQSTGPASMPVEPGAAVPIPPEEAARQMLEYRLRAAGGAGAIQATILEADVTERPLEPKGGFRGYVVNEAVAELQGRLKVRLDRLDEQGAPVGSLSTAVMRTAAIPEDATFVRRQEIAYELVRNLVNDLDVGLISNLQQSFATLIAPPA